MEEENKQLLNDEKDKEEVKPKPQTEEEEEAKSEAPKKASGGGGGGGGGGGWGGWGFSTLSVFSDLQKAAEEISRNVRIHISPLSLMSNSLFLFIFFGEIRVYS